MRLYIGSDYRGFALKQKMSEYLSQQGHEVIDLGPKEYREGDDYNTAATGVALDVRADEKAFGILICESAHGMTIQANRFLKVRAAHCENEESARLAREHDDANVLCLSAHFLNESAMEKIIDVFLATQFEPLERRVRRVKKLDDTTYLTGGQVYD